MNEFFMNAMGYITLAAMVISIVYTWGKLNYELKKMEKAK